MQADAFHGTQFDRLPPTKLARRPKGPFFTTFATRKASGLPSTNGGIPSDLLHVDWTGTELPAWKFDDFL